MRREYRATIRFRLGRKSEGAVKVVEVGDNAGSEVCLIKLSDQQTNQENSGQFLCKDLGGLSDVASLERVRGGAMLPLARSSQRHMQYVCYIREKLVASIMHGGRKRDRSTAFRVFD